MKNIEIKDKIIMRKAKKGDGEQFVKVINKVWRIAYKDIFPEEVFLERDRKVNEKIAEFEERVYDIGKLYLVVEDNKKIVGVMRGAIKSEYDYFKEKDYADLEILYILPEYQNLGIGKNFKQEFLKWIEKNDVKKYVIGVLKENFPARKVYERWGGNLDDYKSKITKLGLDYEEVFYTFDVNI